MGYIVPEQVLSRELDGEAVLLDLRSGHYFGLNATASRMWVLVREGFPADDIIRALTIEFEVDEDVARRDVESFVSSLLERGLLVSTNGKA